MIAMVFSLEVMQRFFDIPSKYKNEDEIASFIGLQPGMKKYLLLFITEYKNFINLN